MTAAIDEAARKVSFQRRTGPTFALKEEEE
jgi:hypothetical protein